MLSWFSLQLPDRFNKRQIAHKSNHDIRLPNLYSQLSNRLKINSPFQIPDSPANFNQHDIRHFSMYRGSYRRLFRFQISNGDKCHFLDPLLNTIRNMWNHLNCFSEILPLSLIIKYSTIHLPGSNVMIFCQGYIKGSFIIA